MPRNKITLPNKDDPQFWADLEAELLGGPPEMASWWEKQKAIPGNAATYANKGTAPQVAARIIKEWKAKHDP